MKSINQSKLKDTRTSDYSIKLIDRSLSETNPGSKIKHYFEFHFIENENFFWSSENVHIVSHMVQIWSQQLADHEYL